MQGVLCTETDIGEEARWRLRGGGGGGEEECDRGA